jgi:hypothetical protein
MEAMGKVRVIALTLLCYCADMEGLRAQESGADLAKKLANPISSLISVPFQGNYDCCIAEEAAKYTLNIQPVVPLTLNEDWNLIVRTIVPVIYQEAPAIGFDDTFGLGDTTQSFFFSPSQPVHGITWGIGPAFLWPTGTDQEIDSGKWGAGPTGVVLRQQGPWTYGILANHIWSYADAGGEEKPEVSSTFLQPFINHTWPNTVGITLNTESTYNWETDEWTVPINVAVSRIVKFGKLPVSLQAGGRVYAVSPENGPEWGLRFSATMLFPRKQKTSGVEQ